ncbi:hypothetical protein WCD74_02515 [Actinomycetospora sp. OC33-EN08]|uniref:Tetratricopeptide repeat protein n=1 Tax=Actinomycetospora aurantiaca TaxID=3129233 RepID=A0ABU8MHC9_9PSEU
MIAGTTTAIALAGAVLTNLVTGDDPPWWLLVAFGVVTVLSIGLAAWGAVEARRAERFVAEMARDAVLRPVANPPDWSDGRPELVALLSAWSRTTPFVGRSRAMDEFLAWIEDASVGTVRVLCGSSGAGKTRLALEIAASAPTGWVGGIAVPGRLGEVVPRTEACGEPAVVVVDDADLVPDLAALLVALDGARVRLKLILVVRDPDAVNAALVRDGHDHLVRQRPVIDVEPVGEDGDRSGWFAQALEAFLAALGTPAPRRPRSDVGIMGERGEPMAVLVARAALAAFEGGTATSITAVRTTRRIDLAQRLVDAEEARWRRAASTSRGSVSDPSRAAAVLALIVSGVADCEAAVGVLGAVTMLRGRPEGELRDVVEWATTLYPETPGVLVGPQPEFLRAALVMRVLRDERLDVDSLLAADGFQPTVLTRSAAWFPESAPVLERLLDVRPDLISDAVLASVLAGFAAQRTLVPALETRLVTYRLPPSMRRRLLPLVDRLGTSRLHVVLREQELDDVAAEPRPWSWETLRAVADARSEFVEALTDSGEFDRASAMASVEVEERRALGPGALCQYATALRSEAFLLSLRGFDRNALDGLAFAVAQFRLIPPSAERDGEYGWALTITGKVCLDLQLNDRALEALSSALTLLAPLVDLTRPSRVPRTLEQLSRAMRHRQRYEEGMQYADDAVARIGRQPPHAKESRDEAACLLARAKVILKTSSVSATQPAMEEVTIIARRMFQAEPRRFASDYATALANLSEVHQLVGMADSALALIEEAVAIRLDVVEHEPGREADLQEARVRYAWHLLHRDRLADAVRVAESAVGGLEALDGRSVALADGLGVLGTVEWRHGRLDAACGHFRRAAAATAALAEQAPEVGTSVHASYLEDVAGVLSDMGAIEGELDVRGEVAAWWARLAELAPDRVRKQLNEARRTLARRVSEAGLSPGAAVDLERIAAGRVAIGDEAV